MREEPKVVYTVPKETPKVVYIVPNPPTVKIPQKMKPEPTKPKPFIRG